MSELRTVFGLLVTLWVGWLAHDLSRRRQFAIHVCEVVQLRAALLRASCFLRTVEVLASAPHDPTPADLGDEARRLRLEIEPLTGGTDNQPTERDDADES